MVMVPEHVDLDHDDGTEQLQERFAHVTEELSKTCRPSRFAASCVRCMAPGST
jgi:hypothetical protein